MMLERERERERERLLGALELATLLDKPADAPFQHPDLLVTVLVELVRGRQGATLSPVLTAPPRLQLAPDVAVQHDIGVFLPTRQAIHLVNELGIVPERANE